MARRGGSTGPIIEADWSEGERKDMPRSAIQDGGVYSSTDYMLDRQGIAYKRGGTAYYGPACTGATYLASGTFADFSAGSQLVGIGDNGHLYVVTSSTATDVATLGTGFPTKDIPKLRVGGSKELLVIPANDGTTAPKVYNGATVATLGGSPPTGRYCAIHKTRIALASTSANPTRLFFSQTPDPEATWNTTTSWFDFDYPITGLASLQDLLLVFSRGHLEVLRGDTPPPGTNMSRGVLGAVGTTDARSIVSKDGSVYFASPRGVYVTNGASFVSLTEQAGIDAYWQNLFTTYVSSTWTLAAGVFQHLLFVSVLDASRTLVECRVFNIPRRSSWRLTNIKPMQFTSALGTGEELFVLNAAANRFLILSGLIAPVAGIKNDADGTAVTPMFTSRMLGRGPGVKHFGLGWLTYDMRDAATDNPTLTVSTTVGPLATTSQNVTEPTSFAETTDIERRRMMIGRIDQGLNVTVAQTGASSKTELYVVEVEEQGINLMEGGRS